VAIDPNKMAEIMINLEVLNMAEFFLKPGAKSNENWPERLKEKTTKLWMLIYFFSTSPI
jgi:hypothetical protein